MDSGDSSLGIGVVNRIVNIWVTQKKGSSLVNRINIRLPGRTLLHGAVGLLT